MAQVHSEAAPPREESSALFRLAQLLRPYSGRLLATLILLIGLTGVNILVPQLIRVFFDRVLAHQNWSLLFVVLGGLLGLYLLRNLLYFLSKYGAVAIGENVSFDLRNRLFERLQQMNLQYYRQNKPGQLSSRVMNDSFVIQQFIQDDVPKLGQALLLFLGILAVVYAMNWQLALASTLVLPLHLWTFHRFKRPIKAASRTAQEHMATATGNLIERFLGMEVVKGFTAEARESEIFEHAIEQTRRSQLEGQRWYVGQKVIADLLIGLGTIALIGFGGYLILTGQMQEGAFIAFFFYIKMLYPTVGDLMGGFAKLARTTAGIDRVSEVLASSGDEAQQSRGLRPAIRGGIRFEDVSFRYDQGPAVLKHVSFSVEPGEVCAIVGPSGAGKSTLCNMVPRFNEPDTGRVCVDGTDIREIDLRHLREAIGIAFQECFLFNSTILENLRYARPQATYREIVEIAERAGALEFIMKLPKGYDTVVGESGVTLSRGQKQLITLVRAMLKNPRVLILDEATTSIDAARESQVLPAILNFMKSKTTLMITHRPELLKHADRVLQLDEGRVAHFGRPEGIRPMHAPGAIPPEVDFDEPGDDERGGPGLSASSSGSWRGIFGLLLAALVGVGALLGPAPRAEAADDAPATSVAEPEGSAPVRESGRLVPLPGLSPADADELLDVVTMRARGELGYRRASEAETEALPATAPELERVVELARQTPGGTQLLRLGYRVFRSRPVHVWIYGAAAEGATPAVEEVVALIEAARASAGEGGQPLKVNDLDSRIVKLSYVESGRALGVLKGLGYQVIEYTGKEDGIGKSWTVDPTAKVDVEDLPAVMAMPGPDAIDLVGPEEIGSGDNAFGVTGPNRASSLKNPTTGSPVMELMILYHPDRPEQLSEVMRRINRSIDRPARQILMEAMVLEISESGLEKLGVRWDLDTPFGQDTLNNIEDLTFGRLPDFVARNNEQATLDLSVRDVSGHWRMRVEALVRQGEAEILSRPSVLTLDGRQASIRVGEEIPIARSFRGAGGGDFVELDFGYIPVGIMLNVRPRMAAEAREVTLQIDGIVSAEVPGGDLVIRTEDGDELGRAPRISTRRVQTYARVANNTPFIIGGLVSRDDAVEVDKVPFLGDIPIIKHAFRSTRVDRLKREVIIVLTPYILPEDQVVGRNLPKDEDAFDSFGNQLFRDAYRIRSDDVFELSFLTQNRRIERLQSLADQVAAQNAEIAEQYPFSAFVNGRIPGEQILVFRQMYEVLKRIGLDEKVDPGRMILFRPDAAAQAGFSVVSLEDRLREAAAKAWERKHGQPPSAEQLSDPLALLEDHALALTYTSQWYNDEADKILRQPVPEVKLVECPDQETWSRLLWEMNQRLANGKQQRTILLRNQDDLTRLKRAILVKQTAQLNASERELRLSNFTVGRQLLMPTVEPDMFHLLDTDVAKHFFFSEQYYPALQHRLSRAIQALQTALQHPRIRRHTEGFGELPEWRTPAEPESPESQ